MTTSLLTNDQLEMLDGFLMSPRTPAETMDIEMLDGFLVALNIGPSEIAEEAWLPALFAGEIPEFESRDEAEEILGLIRQHAASIKHAFAPKRRDNPGEEPLYVPVILSDEGQDEKWQETMGAYWASGFHAGIAFAEEAWGPLIDANDELFDSIDKILALASDYEAAEENAVKSVKAREERVSELPWHIEDVMYYVLEEKFGKVEQIKREEPKIGRNDPCFCGSGKKFKKCHGA